MYSKSLKKCISKLLKNVYYFRDNNKTRSKFYSKFNLLACFKNNLII